jgi:hypothetical protein
MSPLQAMLATLIFVLSSTQFQSFYTSASAMHGCPPGAGGRVGLVALPVKALKAGQEAYWLDQIAIARNCEEYVSGRGEWSRATRDLAVGWSVWSLCRIAAVKARMRCSA